jgi:hypothetical protein
MHTMRWLTGLSVLGALLALSCQRAPTRPDVRFAPAGAYYQEKLDFARIEHQLPLSRAERNQITPENIRSLTQEEIDQVYARLTAGPIPDEPFQGSVYLAKGVGLDRIAEEIGGLKGWALELKMKALQDFAEVLWKGKVFYRDQRVLRNRIKDTRLLAPLIDDDLSSLPKITVDHKDAWLLFPAKLYCGQSLLDSRRESIIIDYAFTDEIDGYRHKPDYLAGRDGFQVRDEIRMVRPGFYLGRAYLAHVFVLNFMLYNDEIAQRDGPAFDQGKPISEDCWTGEQLVAAVQ